MEQANITEKIQALFEDIRDALSRDEINDIRYKIFRNNKLYEYYANKTN